MIFRPFKQNYLSKNNYLINKINLGFIPKVFQKPQNNLKYSNSIKTYYKSRILECGFKNDSKEEEDIIPLVESHWEEFENEVKKELFSNLKATNVKVIDKTVPGCGDMIEIHVTSPLFIHKNQLEQSRMVLNVLKDLIEGIHGVTIKTKIT